MNWTEVSKQPHLSEAFIREHKDEVDWKMIAKHQKLSKYFIMKHTSKLFIHDLKQNPFLSFTEEEWKALFPDYFIKMEKHNQLLEQISDLDIIIERAMEKMEQIESLN